MTPRNLGLSAILLLLVLPLLPPTLAAQQGKLEAEMKAARAEIQELRARVAKLVSETTRVCQSAYDEFVRLLQPYAKKRQPGLDNLSARKQARGAARGFLGNALQTELVFSASVQQWHWMLDQRASQWADAEIREIYARESATVIAALRESQYAEEFAAYKNAPSPDGIGSILVKE